MLQTRSADQPEDSTQPIVSLLLEQMLLETLKGRAVIPMAALCKRLGVRMSTLQRQLSALESYELVEVRCDESGRWTTVLTPQGMEFCQSAEAA